MPLSAAPIEESTAERRERILDRQFLSQLPGADSFLALTLKHHESGTVAGMSGALRNLGFIEVVRESMATLNNPGATEQDRWNAIQTLSKQTVDLTLVDQALQVAAEHQDPRVSQFAFITIQRVEVERAEAIKLAQQQVETETSAAVAGSETAAPLADPDATATEANGLNLGAEAPKLDTDAMPNFDADGVDTSATESPEESGVAKQNGAEAVTTSVPGSGSETPPELNAGPGLVSSERVAAPQPTSVEGPSEVAGSTATTREENGSAINAEPDRSSDSPTQAPASPLAPGSSDQVAAQPAAEIAAADVTPVTIIVIDTAAPSSEGPAAALKADPTTATEAAAESVQPRGEGGRFVSPNLDATLSAAQAPVSAPPVSAIPVGNGNGAQVESEDVAPKAIRPPHYPEIVRMCKEIIDSHSQKAPFNYVDDKIVSNAVNVLASMGRPGRSALPNLIELAAKINTDSFEEVAAAIASIGTKNKGMLLRVITQPAEEGDQRILQVKKIEVAIQALGEMGADESRPVTSRVLRTLREIASPEGNEISESRLRVAALSAIAKIVKAQEIQESAEKILVPVAMHPVADSAGEAARSANVALSNGKVEPTQTGPEAERVAQESGASLLIAAPVEVTSAPRFPAEVGLCKKIIEEHSAKTTFNFVDDKALRLAIQVLAQMGNAGRSAVPLLITLANKVPHEGFDELAAAIASIGVNERAQLLRTVEEEPANGAHREFQLKRIEVAINALGKMGPDDSIRVTRNVLRALRDLVPSEVSDARLDRIRDAALTAIANLVKINLE